ncbi:MAG TPA: amidohydrolase family protein [Pirellulales bacterium]|nr:amidohydrolase family protein [Pirellulales bacterium]
MCLLVVFAAAVWFTSARLAADEPAYDLLIRNGRIVDGTGNPWFYGDVAVRGDRIAAIGRVPDATARRTIDARGLVVSPGFIDIHSHSDLLLLEDGHAQSKIRQGVTTEILGEGSSAGPYTGQLPSPPADVRGTPRHWSTLAEYFDLLEGAGVSLEGAGVSLNVASYVGLGNIWQCVMGTSFARPTPEQLAEMERLVEQAMNDGALGLSSQLMMPPGSLATTDDIVALCKVAARHGGIYSTHIRNEGSGAFESVKEAIEIGDRARIPVDVIHLKIADQKLWGRMSEIAALIDDARRRGVNVQANVYPYTRGNNDLASIIPPWAHEGGKEQLLARLNDAGARRRMKREIRDGLPGWYNHFTAVGGDWGRMLISADNAYKGLTMDRWPRRA